jgi:hypothetical protein
MLAGSTPRHGLESGMSDWMLYDEIVDRVNTCHLEAYSGLIIGVTETRHSFQIGFEGGEIILLTYRVKKGMDALGLITQIERARVAEHPNSDMPGGRDNTLDTDNVIARLVSRTADDTTTITRMDVVPAEVDSTDITIPGQLDARMRKTIEKAARDHFGPIGALICEERLDNPEGDVRTILLSIAHEAGASDADTRAFLERFAKA